MSWIRSTTNIEELYVFESVEGRAEFQWTDKKGRRQNASCDVQTWYALMEKYWKNGGFSLEDTYSVSDICLIERLDFIELVFDDQIDQSIQMQRVTWDCLVREYERRRLYNWRERVRLLFNRLTYFN